LLKTNSAPTVGQGPAGIVQTPIVQSGKEKILLVQLPSGGNNMPKDGELSAEKMKGKEK